MNYHGKGQYQWDTWYCKKEGSDEMHAFYLQCSRPDGPGRDMEREPLGHAVSRNLLDWEELPPALELEPSGQPGDMTSWTGSTIYHDGTYYMYYTIRSSCNRGRHQAIGLATSKDLTHWVKHPGNPVILPDGRWYNTPENLSIGGLVDCRDLMVVKHPSKPGHFGVFASRIPTEELPQGSVFAGAYTEDMVHWEQTPPVYRSERDAYSIVEMPDLFFFEGKWVLTWLEDTSYGNRHILGSPFLTSGTVYALADTVEGPYKEPEDNILIASMGFNGFSCRTVDWKGKKYVLYSMAERKNENELKRTFGTLGIPKEIKMLDGRLCVCYPEELLEEKMGAVLLSPMQLLIEASVHNTHETLGRWQREEGRISGSVSTAWCRYSFDASGASFVYAANITVEKGVAAGLIIRQGADKIGGVALLDFDRQTLGYYTVPRFQIVDERSVPLSRGQRYHLRILTNNQFIEVYLNDVLILQFVCYLNGEGRFGLLLDRAQGTFENITARELENYG